MRAVTARDRDRVPGARARGGSVRAFAALCLRATRAQVAGAPTGMGMATEWTLTAHRHGKRGARYHAAGDRSRAAGAVLAASVAAGRAHKLRTGAGGAA